MALPQNELSDPAVAAVDYFEPDGRVRTSLLTDYELGGIAIGDPSQGLQVQIWEGQYSGGKVQIKPETGSTWADVLTIADLTEFTFTFDQNMRPAVAYIAAGAAAFYWFDTVPATYVTTALPSAASPVITLDDKRPMQLAANDVLLFYLRSGRVYYRQQRERFGTERDIGAIPSGTTRITRWGMSKAFRLQLEFGGDPSGGGPGPGPAGQYGTAYTDLLTDTLYVESAGDVIPFLETGRRTGIWRTPKFVLASHESYSWAKLVGTLTANVTVRVYRAGALSFTKTVSTNVPFRLGPGRKQPLEIEIESQSTVVSVIVASSAEELAQS